MKPEDFRKPNRELPIRIKRGNEYVDLNALNPKEITDDEFREWFKFYIKSRYDIEPETSLDTTDVSTTSARQTLIDFLSFKK